MKKVAISIVFLGIAALLMATTVVMSEPLPAKEDLHGDEPIGDVKEVVKATVSLDVPTMLTVTLAITDEKMIHDLVTAPLANAKVNKGPLTPSILFGRITLKMKDGSEEKCVLLCPWGYFDADDGLHLPSGRRLKPGGYIADLSGLGKLLVKGLDIVSNGITAPAPEKKKVSVR
jgi:hypothetical protein